MGEDGPIFKGSLESIESLDIESPIQDITPRTCCSFSSEFGKLAKTARDSQNDAEAAVYQFLATLTSFFPNYSDVVNPYSPMWQMDGKQSLIPSDLHAEDFKAIRALANKASEPALRARLFDILWIKEHNHLDCEEAVTSYLEAAQWLDTEEDWIYSKDQYQRAFQLAKVLGWKQSPYLSAEKQLLAAISRDRESETEYRTCYLLEIALEFHCGDEKPEELAKIAGEIGDRASEFKDHRKAREYWTIQSKYLPRDQAASNETLRKAAETYISEADERAATSKWAASTMLKDGIEALRRINEEPSRIQELKARLLDYQEASTDELQTFEHKIDISESVKAVRQDLSGYNLFDALTRLAYGVPTTDLDGLKQSVLDAIKEFPLSHLFTTTLMDNKGRTRVETDGFDFAQAGDNQSQIKAKMFEEFGRSHVTVRAQSFIRPAREQLYNEHHPQAEDLVLLVENNPFVPPNHEGIFLRGLHYGLCGDFLIAAHLLVPQIENSLRYVLESDGVDVSNLMSDGTQPVKVLGALFDLEETKKIFGESLCFELRGLLIEKTACDFRNKLAHGFVTEDDCYSDAAVNIWWLVLVLCISPICNGSSQKQQPEELESQEAE